MRDTDDSEKVVRDIIRLAVYTEITRHTRGRIHLKYSLLGLMPADALQ
jgi:hypothetical protein